MKSFIAMLVAISILLAPLTAFAANTVEYHESSVYSELADKMSGNSEIGAFVDYKTLVDRNLNKLESMNSAERQQLVTDILTQAGIIYINDDEVDFTQEEYADYFAYAVANVAETKSYLKYHGISAVASFPITIDFGGKSSVTVTMFKSQYSQLASGLLIKNSGIGITLDEYIFMSTPSDNPISISLIKYNKNKLPEKFAQEAKSDILYQLVLADGVEISDDLPDVSISFYSTAERDKFYSLREKQDGSVTAWHVNAEYDDGVSTFIVNDVRIFGIYSAEDVAEQTFDDVPPNHWAYEYIMELLQRGVVSGKGDNTFDPDGYVTREEFVKMLIETADLKNTDAKCDFNDVSEDEWYYQYVAAAYEAKLINGVTVWDFGVGQNIKREDVATIIYRMGLNLEKPFEINSGFFDNNIKIDDLDQVSAHAYTAVIALNEDGIITTDEKDRVRPQDYATRAELAKILCLVAKHIEQY